MQFFKKLIQNKYIKFILIAFIGGAVVYAYMGRSTIKSLNVKKVNIEKHVVERTVSASGVVKSSNDATLSFGSSGKINKVYVEEGDKIQSGQLLAILDSSSLYSTIQSARDTRDIAERDLDLFKQKYENHKGLLGGDDEYQISLRKQQEVWSQAQSTYEYQLSLQSNLSIRAPFDGTVYKVAKKTGENVVATEAVLQIANLDDIHSEVELDQEDFGSVKLNQPAEIELDAYPNKKLKAYVFNLPEYADPAATARFVVKLNFDNQVTEKPLKGMTGDVHITVDTTNAEVPSIIYDQVYTDENDKYYIWVVDSNGLLEKQPVTVGIEGDVYYELKSDITKQVVTGINNDVVMKEGYKAKIIK
jgi:RND family efflux transporter MFP subunit